jgi:hypothetical protein
VQAAAPAAWRTRDRGQYIPSVDFHDFLEQLHARLQPDTYLEIGVRNGRSLALARCASIGIDPAVELTYELASDVSLFHEASDDYFAGREALAPFGGRPISLALIDGMHLVEYVLRDFINVEKHSLWSSVVVVDDVLPRRASEATRDRATRFWTGDVYKIAAVLARYRPDLTCLKVATAPTGVLLILGLDPHSSALSDRYERIARRAIRANRRGAPSGVLERRDALDPDAVLSASLWSLLRDARSEQEMPRERGLEQLAASLERDLGRSSPRAGRPRPWRRPPRR